MEEDAVLAEDVPGDPHLPPVSGLHHHVVGAGLGATRVARHENGFSFVSEIFG